MKKERKSNVLKLVPLKYIKKSVIMMLVLSIISGLCTVLQVYAVSYFVNQALVAVEVERVSSDLIFATIILLVTVTIDWLSPRFINYIRKKSELILQKEYRTQLLEKCAKLEYSYVENSDSWDLISRVLSDTEQKWMNIIDAVLSLTKLFIGIIGVLFVIAGYVWWAAVLILLFCIPLFAFSIKGGKKNYQAHRDVSKIIRKYNYLDWVLRDRENVNERKLFSYSKELSEKFGEEYRKAFWIETKTQIHWSLKTKMSGGLSSIAALLIVITLIQPTVTGKISIGIFVSLVNAVFQMTSQMSWGLSRNIDALVSGYEFGKDVNNFSMMSEEDGVLDDSVYFKNIETIEFRQVTFRYPGSEIDVLNNVSFIMEYGTNYALVGANGAGKTTVIKLLTGLYDNYSGEILINGKELREYSKAEQKGMFAVVFQDYVQHSMSIRDNLQIANPNGEIDEKLIREKIAQFDMDKFVKDLPNGVDTVLGKIEKEGIDLSGGQWQKLAMIRALIRPAKIRILDEPTAALDPKMESEVYRLFQQLTDDKLTILISHRLGFARMADNIIVFSEGSVLEQGDFETLMNNKGLFYKMFEEQRSWYE